MKVGKFIIWVFFISMLSVSIPKIAWTIAAFDGSNQSSVAVFGIVLSSTQIFPLFAAICVDGVTISLTYTVSQRQGERNALLIWGVAITSVFSSVCNLVYNFAHVPQDNAVWSNQWVTISMAILMACIPFGAMYFTHMLTALNGKGESLEARAIRLENEKTLKNRIKKAKGSLLQNIASSLIEDVAVIKEEATQKFSTVQVEEEGQEQEEETQGSVKEEPVSKLQAPNKNAEEEEEEEETGKLGATIAALKSNPSITDEELSKILHLKRIASVRFWRLKAGNFMKEQGKQEAHTDPEINAVNTVYKQVETFTPVPEPSLNNGHKPVYRRRTLNN